MSTSGAGPLSRRVPASYAPLWLVMAGTLAPTAAFAGETGPRFRTDLGLAGGVFDFLGSYQFVLLFTTLALGTALGRRKLGFLTLGSTAGTLLVGTSISLCAYLGYGIRYAVPGLVTTVFLNLFMFAVGLKVGPQFLAGLRQDGAKAVGIALVVVALNFAVVVDEHGSIEGVVTPSDILTAIAGELPEAAKEEPAEAVARDDSSWLVDGSMSIDDVERLLGKGNMRSGDDYTTLAGFVLAQLGHLPTTGEHFRWRAMRFEVVDMDGRRIDKLLIQRLAS